jgi:hypothetical protein
MIVKISNWPGSVSRYERDCAIVLGPFSQRLSYLIFGKSNGVLQFDHRAHFRLSENGSQVLSGCLELWNEGAEPPVIAARKHKVMLLVIPASSHR